MTQAPARPLMHAYLGDGDPLEIVDSPFGRMERERARSIATGEFSTLVELSKQIRNDSAAVVDRQNARDADLKARADALDQKEREIGVMAVKVAEMAGRMSVEWDKLQKARTDAAEEDLPLPPGSDEVSASYRSKEPDPPQPLESDRSELPAPSRGDQPEFPDPELPHPPVVEQPISVEE